MKTKTIFLTPALLVAVSQSALLATTAHAQAPVAKSPAAAATALPLGTFQSAFKGYQPYAEEKITNWRAANDTVERIGGWREYAKQAQQPADVPANTPAQTNKAGEAAQRGKP